MENPRIWEFAKPWPIINVIDRGFSLATLDLQGEPFGNQRWLARKSPNQMKVSSF